MSTYIHFSISAHVNIHRYTTHRHECPQTCIHMKNSERLPFVLPYLATLPWAYLIPMPFAVIPLLLLYSLESKSGTASSFAIGSSQWTECTQFCKRTSSAPQCSSVMKPGTQFNSYGWRRTTRKAFSSNLTHSQILRDKKIEFLYLSWGGEALKKTAGQDSSSCSYP